MNICVISPILNIAGVPLAQIRLSRALSRMGHNVDLVFGHVQDGNIVSELKDVNVIDFKKKNIRSIIFKLCKYLIRKKPDIIFSAEDHLNIIVSFCVIVTGSKAKISASSRVTPYDTYSKKIFTKKWFLKFLFKLTSWRINLLTCVSEDMVGQYHKVFGYTKHMCIYNIVSDENNSKRMNEPVDLYDFNKNGEDCKFLIAAGKLAKWKGFDYLLRACKELKDKKINFKLIILGDGPEMNNLNELTKELKIDKDVDFLGYVKNPLKYFKKSDIFVLSSLVEGMPNVLIEAMMCGCTIVSTDCETGPKEILKSGKYGYLVPVKNYKELANGILEAIDRPIGMDKYKGIIKLFSEIEVLRKHFMNLKINNQ